MNGYKEVKRKSKKGFFITMGALMTLGAVTVFKKSKGLMNKITSKMKSLGN